MSSMEIYKKAFLKVYFQVFIMFVKAAELRECHSFLIKVCIDLNYNKKKSPSRLFLDL